MLNGAKLGTDVNVAFNGALLGTSEGVLLVGAKLGTDVNVALKGVLMMCSF